MNTPARLGHYKHHRLPMAIISHGVWLYCRFYLSSRNVEVLLFARGIIVTYELRKGSAYVPRVRSTDKRKRYGAAQGERVDRGWSTGNTAISPTVRSMPISPRVRVSGACRGANRRVTPSAALPPMARSLNTAARDPTGCPPPSPAKQWPTDASWGET